MPPSALLLLALLPTTSHSLNKPVALSKRSDSSGGASVEQEPPPVAWSVAGSDSSGGAGVEQDLRQAEEEDRAAAKRTKARRQNSLLSWLLERRDIFEPAWPWLVERREWSEIVKEGTSI